MLIRVRSNVGIWRVDGLDSNTSTVQSVLDEIAKTRPHVVYTAPLSSDPACTIPLAANNNITLQQLGLQHGSMIHCRVDPSTTVDLSGKTSDADAASSNDHTSASTTEEKKRSEGQHMRRIISTDGKIILVPSKDAPRPGEDKGFRKGMMALRDIKMHWTLSDFVAMDSQFEFKIQRQKEAVCKQVSLDIPSIAKFQAYLQRFQFQRKRFGYLYGKYVPADNDESSGDEKRDEKNNRKVLVEAIYEPPQEPDNETAEGFIPADDDPWEDSVQKIASYLGWKKVGWIYGHEAREPGFVMSAAEVIMAAELQLEAADGVNETPFVTVKVAPAPEGTGVSVEAFQVSQQCMAMVAEEALEVAPDPKICNVNATFTAIQEGKPSPTVENNFFLTVVPIVQHTSDLFIADFPSINRDLDDRAPSKDELKQQLAKSGTAGWTFIDRIADFNLLIYLSQFLDVNNDFPKICTAIVDRSIPLDDGYKILIKSMAGLDTAY